MANTLTYQTGITFRTDDFVWSLQPTSVELAMGSKMQADRVTATFAAAITIALGEVTAPTVAYFHNADATNFVTITDDATFLAKIPAGRTVCLNLAGTETLKAQADTADCLLDYALFEEA